jgi:DNA-directed RNA polymerase subunit RPC12/RpoP
MKLSIDEHNPPSEDENDIFIASVAAVLGQSTVSEGEDYSIAVGGITGPAVLYGLRHLQQVSPQLPGIMVALAGDRLLYNMHKGAAMAKLTDVDKNDTPVVEGAAPPSTGTTAVQGAAPPSDAGGMSDRAPDPMADIAAQLTKLNAYLSSPARVETMGTSVFNAPTPQAPIEYATGLCERCGAYLRVRKQQAAGEELWDCPICGYRNMTSIKAAAESHGLAPDDPLVRERFRALGHRETVAKPELGGV